MSDVAIVISAFNQRHTLELVLAGLARQTKVAFDAVVADDGSDDGTEAYLSRTTSELPFNLAHVWLPNEGFRKSRALNAAVAASDAAYLIFIDGDCIPHRKFVQAHLAAREPGFSLCGRAVRMSQRFTQRVTRAYVESGRLDRLNPALLWDGLVGESRNTNRTIPYGVGVLSSLDKRRRPPTVHGLNHSVWRRDFDRVEGFDESYVGHGLEDYDFGFRLSKAGVRQRRVRHGAIVFHCYHDGH